MLIDPVNQLTFSSTAAKSQVNNVGAFLMDCLNYEGQIAVVVDIGVKTVGDADGAIAIGIATSNTNNISNAVNYTPTVGNATVATSNNATATAAITFNPRDTGVGRYVFTRYALTGTNSPAYPVAVVALGTQRVQPNA